MKIKFIGFLNCIEISEINMDCFVRQCFFSRSSAETIQSKQVNKLATDLTNKIIVLLKSINRNDSGKLNIVTIIYRGRPRKLYLILLLT